MEIVKFVKTDEISAKIEVLFNFEKEKLQKLFPNSQIEHIGGTSVPGLITKGDLDINIRVKEKEFKTIIEILKTLYQINQPHNWNDVFASFKDDSRDIGIQLTILNSKEDYFVAQRDYLINHPELIEQLNNLKQKFDGKDMEEYREEKGKFFEELNYKNPV